MRHSRAKLARDGSHHSVVESYEIYPQALRLYEREGLLRPSRSEGNTRLYTDENLDRLEVILNLTRDLGVNLAGVEIILNMCEKMEGSIWTRTTASKAACAAPIITAHNGQQSGLCGTNYYRAQRPAKRPVRHQLLPRTTASKAACALMQKQIEGFGATPNDELTVRAAHRPMEASSHSLMPVIQLGRRRQFDVIIEKDEDEYYVASVPQIPGCHTQPRSLDELTDRIREAIELCLELDGTPTQNLEFVRGSAHTCSSLEMI